MSENMYDAWDNGDRHEIRQRFARREEIIRMAREAGLIDYCDLEGDSVGLLALVTLCQDVAAAEREACARVAESLWQQYQDTKDAHERMSPQPFMPGRFGFDQSTVQQSRRIADAIRERGQA